MKTMMLFVFASLLVTSTGFAATGQNTSAKCKEIADKVREAKAAPATGKLPGQQVPVGGTTTVQ